PTRIRAHGAVDLGLLQKYLNFWCSSSLDLFGNEISSNSAANFANGLKGRPDESTYDDHVLREKTFEFKNPQGVESVPMLNALNEVLRDDFIDDSAGGIERWNKRIAKTGITFRLALPHKAFNRRIGTLSSVRVSPEGEVVTQERWNDGVSRWLPTDEDRAFVASLMGRVVEPGRFAGWIAPPAAGIDRHPLDFEYVRFG
ncbi:MAG: hypothetical protein ACXWHA_11260, partial [Usitatibacter sp.]